MAKVLSDNELKEKLAASVKTEHVAPVKGTYKFPTEIIELPSKGKLYPLSNLLSEGKVEMKYMTAAEEDILTSQTILKHGNVVERLLQSLILTKINIDDLVAPDLNALLYAARVLAYGKEYNVEITCPKCGTENKTSVDLSALNDLEVDWTQIPDNKNEFEFELPASKVKITFKILTQSDEKLIEAELKSRKKMSSITGVTPELTTRLSHIITSVNGNTDKLDILEFVNNMLTRDSLALRRYIQTVTPGNDTRFEFNCSECSHSETIPIPMDVSFFWPRA